MTCRTVERPECSVLHVSTSSLLPVTTDSPTPSLYPDDILQLTRYHPAPHHTLIPHQWRFDSSLTPYLIYSNSITPTILQQWFHHWPIYHNSVTAATTLTHPIVQVSCVISTHSTHLLNSHSQLQKLRVFFLAFWIWWWNHLQRSS